MLARQMPEYVRHLRRCKGHNSIRTKAPSAFSFVSPHPPARQIDRHNRSLARCNGISRHYSQSTQRRLEPGAHHRTTINSAPTTAASRRIVGHFPRIQTMNAL